jgi:hypothetical protein
MRLVFTSLIAFAGLATAAAAQQPAPDAMAPTPAAPPAATAPAPAAAPAAPAAPAAEAPPPAPTLPTTGDGAAALAAITQICVPVVKGGDLAKLAPPLGYKFNRRDGTYTATFGAKPYVITIFSQGSNKDVCRVGLTYAIDGEKPIIEALNVWSFLHDPELKLQRNDFIPATDFKRITTSWEYFTDHESTGLVFMQLKKPDGTPVNAKWDQAELLYSERKF